MAKSYNLVGPNLRASGVKYDVRKNHPYSVYDEFDFDVPIGEGEMGQVGDCWGPLHDADQRDLRVGQDSCVRRCDRFPTGR